MEKNKGGRPPIIIDKKIFEMLCKLQCTKDEICANVIDNGIDEKTLTKWCIENYGEGFSDIFKKKSSDGKISLRRLQWKAAHEGNTTMLVWLGKQYLSQADKNELTGKEGNDLIIKIISD